MGTVLLSLQPVLMFYCEDRIAGKFHQSITILIVLGLALLTKPSLGWSMQFLVDSHLGLWDGRNRV